MALTLADILGKPQDQETRPPIPSLPPVFPPPYVPPSPPTYPGVETPPFNPSAEPPKPTVGGGEPPVVQEPGTPPAPPKQPNKWEWDFYDWSGVPADVAKRLQDLLSGSPKDARAQLMALAYQYRDEPWALRAFQQFRQLTREIQRKKNEDAGIVMPERRRELIPLVGWGWQRPGSGQPAPTGTGSQSRFSPPVHVPGAIEDGNPRPAFPTRPQTASDHRFSMSPPGLLPPEDGTPGPLSPPGPPSASDGRFGSPTPLGKDQMSVLYPEGVSPYAGLGLTGAPVASAVGSWINRPPVQGRGKMTTLPAYPPTGGRPGGRWGG